MFGLGWEDVFLFFVYSYIGATLEHLSYFFGSGGSKALSNPIIEGFPLYGIGAYIVILINERVLVPRHLDNIVYQFLIFGLILTTLEYIVGLCVGAGKNSYTKNGTVASWDYSNQPFNFQGIVGLRQFVVWGIMGIVVVRLQKVLYKKFQCAFE